MKVARVSFLTILLLAMFLALNARAASAASADTITETVVNADGGVYWRSDPDWNTPITLTQQGVYTGDIVKLACYTRGSTVPPYYNNPLWYWAEIFSGYGQGSGWVNDHFLDTGTNQPNIPVDGVSPCPEYPYVWSNSGIAYVRAQPGDSMYYEPVLYNGYSLALICWIDGGWAQGDYWTNRWFQVAVPYDTVGTVGYINASVLANRYTLPQCDSTVSQ